MAAAWKKLNIMMDLGYCEIHYYFPRIKDLVD